MAAEEEVGDEKNRSYPLFLFSLSSLVPRTPPASDEKIAACTPFLISLPYSALFFYFFFLYFSGFSYFSREKNSSVSVLNISFLNSYAGVAYQAGEGSARRLFVFQFVQTCWEREGRERGFFSFAKKKFKINRKCKTKQKQSLTLSFLPSIFITSHHIILLLPSCGSQRRATSPSSDRSRSARARKRAWCCVLPLPRPVPSRLRLSRAPPLPRLRLRHQQPRSPYPLASAAPETSS